jgi:glycosyltransferase involved in cell wall biosynthesis
VVPDIRRDGRFRRLRVRILFLSVHYGTMGGVRLIVDALAAAARDEGHQVAAVVDGDAARFAGPARELALYPFPARTRDFRRLRRFARKFPLAATRLLAASRALAPDVVSVHCVRRFAPYVAVLRRLGGTPQVLNLQEAALPPGVPENPGLFRLLAGTADAVAACSAEAAGYARRVGGARRVEIVPNGYEPREFVAGPPWPHPRAYVLGLGRLEPQKGFDVLIDALARLGRPDVDLLLAGDGSAREALMAQSRARGVAPHVHFLGNVDRAATVALLRGAAVVAVPSRFEGLPLVCIEAFAAARPVVAAAVNGTPELVRDGDTGWLVPPDDAAALAVAIGHALDVPEEATRRAERGRGVVEREHRWPIVARRWLALCAEVSAPGVAAAA